MTTYWAVGQALGADPKPTSWSPLAPPQGGPGRWHARRVYALVEKEGPPTKVKLLARERGPRVSARRVSLGKKYLFAGFV